MKCTTLFRSTLAASIAAGCLAVSPCPVPAEDILFIVGNDEYMSPGDAGVIRRLESYGFNVVVKDDQDDNVSDADGKVLVIISATIQSGAVGATYKDVPVPVLDWEQAVQDDFDWTFSEQQVDEGEFNNQSNLVITAEGASHPMGAGLSAGTYQVTTGGQRWSFGWPNYDLYSPYVDVIAQFDDGDPTHVAIYGYDVGDRLIDGSTNTVARRAFIFLQENTFAFLNLTGLRLFDAAIAWSLSDSNFAGINDVTITTPAHGANFAAGGNVTIDVTATAKSGSVTNVEFFANGVKIGEDSSSPFSLTWSNVAEGGYFLTAKASDSGGYSGVSKEARIDVGDSYWAVYCLRNLSGANSSDRGVMDRMAAFGIDVDVSTDLASTTDLADEKDLVVISSTVSAQIDYVTNKFRHVSTPVLMWEEALQDDNWMTYDDTNNTYHGEVDNQTEIVITAAGAAHPLGAGLSAGTHEVMTTPVTLPWGYPNYDVQTPYCDVIARINDGTNSHVCLYGYEVGDQLLDPGLSVTAPGRRVFTFLHNNTFTDLNDVGTMLLDAALAWAIGVPSLGEFPTVSITSPTNGTSYALGADITITADAADGDGTVAKVEFYADGAKIGEDTTSPFSLEWSNVGLGKYALTAVAIDNTGFSTESEAANITVGTFTESVLLVVASSNPANPNESEVAIAARLESMGMDVTIQGANQTDTEDADDKDLVVTSSTMSSGHTGAKFQTSAVPCLNWEQAIQDDFLMTLDGSTDHGETDGFTDIVITDPNHPLAGGLSAGTHTVYNNPGFIVWGSPTNTAEVAATTSDTNAYPCLYGYDTGELLIDGTTPAPARRVNIFLHNNTFIDLTDDGLRLFDAAVAWAMDIDLTPVITSLDLGGGVLTLIWERGGTLQWTDDLVNGIWADLGDGGYYEDPMGTGNRYYRIAR